jgi:CBS domain-containing protein
MAIGEICNREVVVVQRQENILEAARLMRQHHVGDVVVVEERGGVRIPVGIVTDRDLVVEVIATEVDQSAFTVGDIMSPELATIREDAGVFETIEYMRAKAVRRMPVVSESGALVGILALDDLLELLAEELLALAKLARHEQKKETINRR